MVRQRFSIQSAGDGTFRHNAEVGCNQVSYLPISEDGLGDVGRQSPIRVRVGAALLVAGD